MSFTIILIRDPRDGPTHWCGEYYDTREQAESNTIFGQGLGVRVVVENWDHTIEVPCLHGIHQHDCARCQAYQCVHMNRPEDCARCVAYRAAELIMCWECGDEHLWHERLNRNGTYSDCPKCGSQITSHPHSEPDPRLQ